MTNREKLRELISKTNLNHTQLGDLIDIPARTMSRYTIQEYLQGRRDTPDYVIEQLTEKLGG